MDNYRKTQEMLSLIDLISNPIIEGKVNEKWWFEEIAKEHLVGNMKSWIVRIRRYGVGHLLRCIKWLVSPFVIRCYMGMIRRMLKGKWIRHD